MYLGYNRFEISTSYKTKKFKNSAYISNYSLHIFCSGIFSSKNSICMFRPKYIAYITFCIFRYHIVKHLIKLQCMQSLIMIDFQNTTKLANSRFGHIGWESSQKCEKNGCQNLALVTNWRTGKYFVKLIYSCISQKVHEISQNFCEIQE